MTDLKIELISRPIDDPVGDLVFVHGLGSDGKSAWSPETRVGKGESQTEIISYFPAVLAADFPNCNVWVLDYSAAISDWIEHSKFRELPRYCANIINYLSGNGVGSRKLVFVCHSLGGIMVKEMLRLSSQSKFDRIQRVSENCVAVSFIATPHKGSNWANVVTAINKVLPFLRASIRLEELEHDNVYLEQLSQSYRKLSSENHIETQAFFEIKKTGPVMVVPHYSANPDVEGCFPIGINRNHIEISKPSRKSDEVYVSICGLINYHFLDGAPVAGLETPQNSIPPQTIVIGIIVRKNKVLMVRRRNPTDNLTWQFVAGRQKVGSESEEECIIREAKEETGADVQIVQRLGETVDTITPYKKIYYALKFLGGTVSNNDPVENSEVRWVKIETIDDFVTTKVDPKVRAFLEI